jgi:hypothetical protein
MFSEHSWCVFIYSAVRLIALADEGKVLRQNIVALKFSSQNLDYIFLVLLFFVIKSLHRHGVERGVY